MRPETAELVRYRLARSAESIVEAKLLLANGHVRTAVNRLYYACYYAISALLLTEGYSSPKHSGIRALFDQHWILDDFRRIWAGSIAASSIPARRVTTRIWSRSTQQRFEAGWRKPARSSSGLLGQSRRVWRDRKGSPRPHGPCINYLIPWTIARKSSRLLATVERGPYN